jgi:hypothetical protein
LARVASGLLAWQQPSGAIRERLVTFPGGHYRAPQRNEEYGTSDTSLLQQNGDPVTEMLRPRWQRRRAAHAGNWWSKSLWLPIQTQSGDFIPQRRERGTRARAGNRRRSRSSWKISDP